ncbi:MAG TPA: hypothetical protein VL017_06945 [Devosia sp.]|nr:hypothetical protein [Devosia sp.]
MKFIEFSGEVVGTETWSQTRVSGKSSGMSYGGIGVSNGRTTSTVSNVGQIWVKTDEGEEIAVRANPDKFATREGHRVSMVVSTPKFGPAHMVAGINHVTGKSRRESAAVLYVLVPLAVVFLGWIPLLLIFALPPVGVVASGLFVWAIISIITTAFRIGQAGTSFLNRMATSGKRRVAVGAGVALGDAESNRGTVVATDVVATPAASRAAA